MAGHKAHYATIKDVARLAGTSTATVSYVLNGSTERVTSPQLRQRVLEAARELHYTKSAVASSLRMKRRGIVAILIPQFSNIYFTRVCEGVEDVVFENGFLPLICDTREDPERESRLLESAVAQRVDGVILGPTSAGWKNTALLRKMHIPYVVVGREISPPKPEEGGGSFYVGDDSYQAGYLAGQCLARNGHRNIGVIEWNGCVSSAMDRDLGFFDAVREQVDRGGSLKVESSANLSTEEGYCMTREVLRGDRPTALFFGYHRHAQGGVQYLTEAGYQIPDDISVILIGSPAWASFSTPKYHRIYQHEEWVGSMAGRVLMAQIQGEGDELLREKRHVCSCTLLEGASVKDLTRQA